MFGEEKWLVFKATFLTHWEGANTCFVKPEAKSVDMYYSLKSLFVHYNQLREHIVDFFNAIEWTSGMNGLNPIAFHEYIFSRQVDSPLKSFFMLHTVDCKYSSTNPLVEELSLKNSRQDQVRKLLIRYMMMDDNKETINEYLCTIIPKKKTETKSNFLNMFSTPQDGKDSRTFSNHFIETIIEDCLGQQHLLQLLELIIPNMNEDAFERYHTIQYEKSHISDLGNDFLIPKKLKKLLFNQERIFVEDKLQHLASRSQILASELEEMLNVV